MTAFSVNGRVRALGLGRTRSIARKQVVEVLGPHLVVLFEEERTNSRIRWLLQKWCRQCLETQDSWRGKPCMSSGESRMIPMAWMASLPRLRWMAKNVSRGVHRTCNQCWTLLMGHTGFVGVEDGLLGKISIEPVFEGLQRIVLLLRAACRVLH